MKQEQQNALCAKSEKYGTLDLWVNDEANWNLAGDCKWHIIATYNGKSPKAGYAYALTFDGADPIQVLNNFMGYLCRDTQNWYYKDIVIHWGVHELKFTNNKNVTPIEKDENVRNLEDIKFYYDVEW